MKTLKRGRGFLALLLSVVMFFSMNATAFAAAGSRQQSASGKITIALEGDTSGTSNIVSFNFSTLPSNAKVQRIVISCPLSKHQGTNAIYLTGLYLQSPKDGGLYSAAPATGNTTIYDFAGAVAKGKWYMYLSANCVSSGIPPYWAPYFDPVPSFSPVYSSNVYYPVKMTIYYTY